MYKLKQQVTGMAARDAGVQPPGMPGSMQGTLLPSQTMPSRMQQAPAAASYTAPASNQTQMHGNMLPAWASQVLGGGGMPGGPRASMAEMDSARQMLQQHMDW